MVIEELIMGKSMLELKSRHLCDNYELESMREELVGEIGMQEETTDVLYQLLFDACQERHEAREQLNRSVAEISELKELLYKLLPSNSAETSSVISHVQPDNRNQEILKGNLDIKGSDTLSEAYNTYYDYSSSANGDSRTLFNASLTDSSNLALLKKSFVQESGGRIQFGQFSSNDLAVYPASKVIDILVMGKPLPEKGRFLEAVIGTAPLLETLIIIGQLPNPPPLPSNLIGNDDHNLINQRAVINSKLAIPSSQMLNYKKCSNSINFESLEHAGTQKRFHRCAEKYFQRGTRLDWPDGATSRESLRAVWKLPRLPNLIMQHVQHSAGDLIDLATTV
ncbi:hypothetical protein CRYUN_Cryun16bG0124300 [Craigia yunnanensis]